ncbi:DUF669 domain-containing protein [Listeria fleischmannii]|uniref:Phage protein n=1 Tax=Listeria fleischmannii FSL S10-1203 TaxID=1265822 RepID=W7D0C6_9LIST|nr:DUF669 domain-containing protein [Listeria fleischmannii]EUJ42475.1 phage protein [Listeria fleischmannii FSL S10-1203]
MPFLTVDYNNAGFEPITPGIYEVFVSDYQVASARTGNQVLNLFYTIREDVNQPHRGGILQYDQFTNTPSAHWRFNAIAKAIGVPNGTSLETLEEFAQAVINQDVKVKVILGEVRENGKQFPEVQSFSQTDSPSANRPMPQLKHAYEQPYQRQQPQANSYTNNFQQSPPQQQPNGTPNQNQQFNGNQYGQQAYQSNHSTNQVHVNPDDLPF